MTRASPPSALAAMVMSTAISLVPGGVLAQACTNPQLDPPISGVLDFGQIYVTAGLSGTATLDPATGGISTSGRLVAPQAGSPLSVRVTDASPDCEFLLTITPADRDFAASFTVMADRIAVLEGVLLNTDEPQREWLVRMSNGVAQVRIGGRLEMNTAADGLIDDYLATFTISVDPS